MSGDVRALIRRKVKLVLLFVTKIFGGFALSRWLTRNGFALVCWHGVSARSEHELFPEFFIPTDMLDRRIAFLTRHFEVVTLSDALAQHATGSIRPRQVALTFDDGMASFGQLAVPLLEAHRVSATVYAVSSRLETPLGWKFPARHLVGLASASAVRRAAKARGVELPGLAELRGEAIEHHGRKLRGLASVEQRRSYLRGAARILSVPFEAVLGQRVWEHHTREELADLSRRGFDVQVHSHEHIPVVERPELVELHARTCRKVLEEVTGKPSTDYCYPSGLWTREAWAALRRAGMRSAATCRAGPNFVRTPALALRRYVDHSQFSQLEFEAQVSGVLWLAHAFFSPSRLFAPSEARVEDGTAY